MKLRGLRNFRNKGMKEYQFVVNYFLSLDHKRGKGYRTLAREYKLNYGNIRYRIKTWDKKYRLN